MESIKPIVNITFFKLLRLFNIFDPNSRKIFNFNVYRLINVVVILVIESIIIIGSSGFLFERKVVVNIVAVSEFVFFYLFNSTCIIKAFTFVYKADDIWNLFDVINVDFLTSELCRRQTEVFRKHHNLWLKLLISINILSMTATVQWCSFPIVLSAVQSSAGDTTHRFSNIFNLPFPVTTSNYNNYYVLFYFIEFMILMFLVYTNSCFNTFSITFSCVITAQYEAISRAYENVGQKWNSPQHCSDNENYYEQNCYDDILSIVNFQQKLYLKLKLYYYIVWFMYLSSIIINSGSIIILTYWFDVALTSNESIPILSLIKLFSAFSYFFFELYFLCYLMENISNKKENVRFGMFSSNWTAINIKSKKLLSIALQLEDANRLMIKISPKKFINLQLFANVMMTSYNIISVLLKSRSKQ